MFRKIVVGTAVGALAVAAYPAVSLLAPPPSPVAAQDARGSSRFDPLALSRALCASGASERMSRRGLFISAARAYAQTGAAPDAVPRLIDGVASHDLVPRAAGEEARRWFAQGLGLVHGFNHEEAVRAFRMAQSLEPDCALCLWGEAYALGPNINKPMNPEDAPRAHAAAREALEKAAGASDLERALIEALATRYSADAGADRPTLDAAYADAMHAVADRFPDHDEVQALAVEAAMDAQPWDYWEPGGLRPRGRAGDALARLERVLARNPDHVASIHLHIHMTEASDDPWRSVPHAGRLAALAPGSGHLVHMPSHTWLRIGRFAESLALNVQAVAVDEAYLAQAGPSASAIYRYGYVPHNIHFALTSAQMFGDGPTALAMAERLDLALPMDMAATEGWVQLIKASPWFARIQFAEATGLEALLSEPAPADAPAYVEAAWRYARGEAAARLGRPDDARAEAEALRALDEATDWQEAIPYMPAPQLVQIMQDTILARAAIAENDLPSAIAFLEQAVATQAALPYLEPPFWWYPARQTLAAALLMDGQAERAEQAFFATLVESPDNGWAYWGLAEARAAQGDAAGAEAARTLWRAAWAAGAPDPAIEKL